MSYPRYVYPNRSPRDHYSLVSFEELPADALPFFILWRGTLYTPSSDHIPIDLAAAQAWLNDTQKQAYEQEKSRLESGNSEGGTVTQQALVQQQPTAFTFEQILTTSGLSGHGVVCRLPDGSWTLEKIRERLTSDRTYYLDAVNGVDADTNGSEESPFKNINYALEWVDRHIDPGNYQVILQLADGFYDGGIYCFPDTKRVTIKGNETNHSAVKIANTTVLNTYVININNNSDIVFENIRIDSSNNQYAVIAMESSHIYFRNCYIDSFEKTTFYSSGSGSIITIDGGTIFGTHGNIVLASYGGQARLRGAMTFFFCCLW